MRKFALVGLMVASSAALAACNVQVSGGSENKAAAAAPPAPAPAPAVPANSAVPAAPTGGAAAPSAEVQPGQARQNFTITNNTGHTLVTLNVSASNDNQWGPDILGRDVLATGESAEITFDRGETQCLWDIRGTYDDGDTTDERGVNLCEVATVNLTAR
jgi:hypothetical protein